MYTVLTLEFLSGQHRQLDTNLDHAVILVMTETQGKHDIEPFEFAEICEDSSTPWDTFLRSLTPEQPTSIADTFASALTTRRFQAFWNSLKDRLTPTQRAELADWYRRMAKQRAQRELALLYVD
jgi:hypothetical protein